MYVLLQRLIIDNPNTQPGNKPKLCIERFWSTDTRTPYNTQRQIDANSPLTEFELAPGTEVQRVALASKTRIFFYQNGRVQTRNTGSTPGTGGQVVCTLAQPTLTPNPPNTSDAGASDASIDLLPKLGAPPYQVRLVGPGGYDQTKTAPTSIYPVRFYALADSLDNYQYTVTDQLGCQVSGVFRVSPGTGRAYGTELKSAYYGDADNGTGSRTIWNPNSLQVENTQYNGGGTDGDQYQLAAGEPVDGFYLPDGVTFRQVYSDGSGGVTFLDSSTQALGSTLTLENLILFNPDSVAEQNGAVLVEVLATALPVSFTLNGSTNQTGSFDKLTKGDYTVFCQDAAGNTLSVPFSLTLDYAPRWVLEADSLESMEWRVELWLRGYTGAPETIFMQGSQPVVVGTDGLNGTLGGQGDIPPAVGSTATLNFLCAPGTFEKVVTGTDRDCRADVYHLGKLYFRGYVQPDIYHEPLLSGLLAVSITATDGLATLKDTDMLGHIGQRLATRRPVLNTLLHCLSRTGVSLPVRLFTNRRDFSMSDADAPEELSTTDRAGYWNKTDPVDQRFVVDALAQLLGGTLVQREGTWQVRSPLEAAAVAPGRAYLPGGTPLPSVTAASPAGYVKPLADPATQWGWQEASQQKQTRPGWKSLTGTTDAGWSTNAFVPGEVFSDKYAWLADGSKLRPINGWMPAAGQAFPLVLVQGGEKGSDYATQWLRSSTPAAQDTNYLQSPVLPLVADPESCPAFLTITGKLIPSAYLPVGDFPAAKGTATKAVLAYEVVIDGQRPQLSSTFTFPLAGNLAAKDSSFTVPLPTLPAGSSQAVLRLYAWSAPDADLFSNAPVFTGQEMVQVGDVFRFAFGSQGDRLYESKVFGLAGAVTAPTGDSDATWLRLEETDASSGILLLTKVAVELRPQQATWDGADNFRADGPGGTVRPTQPLVVTHPDVPASAGLFEGNRFAFNKAVALTDGGLTGSWTRTLDKQPSPLFESNVFDALALRAGPSRLLTGTLRYRKGSLPPFILDAVDTPFDVPGHRFIVGAASWDLRAQTVEVSLVEIGAGTDAPDPLLDLPEGVRITHEVYAYAPGKYAPYVRLTHNGGVRVRHA